LKNWQIPLSRDYKAFKSWFVIQELGESGIVQRLRNYVEAGKVAEEHVKNDPRLEMVVKRILSLVVFRVKGENEKTDELVNKLVSDENILLLGIKLFDKSIIRFTPGHIIKDNSNIHEAFRIIFSYLDYQSKITIKILSKITIKILTLINLILKLLRRNNCLKIIKRIRFGSL
jgi:hypothetical protein